MIYEIMISFLEFPGERGQIPAIDYSGLETPSSYGTSVSSGELTHAWSRFDPGSVDSTSPSGLHCCTGDGEARGRLLASPALFETMGRSISTPRRQRVSAMQIRKAASEHNLTSPHPDLHLN